MISVQILRYFGFAHLLVGVTPLNGQSELPEDDGSLRSISKLSHFREELRTSRLRLKYNLLVGVRCRRQEQVAKANIDIQCRSSNDCSEWQIWDMAGPYTLAVAPARCPVTTSGAEEQQSAKISVCGECTPTPTVSVTLTGRCRAPSS